MKYLLKLNYTVLAFLAVLLVFSCSSPESEEASVETSASITTRNTTECTACDSCENPESIGGQAFTWAADYCSACITPSDFNLPDQSYEWCATVEYSFWPENIFVSTYSGEVSGVDEQICLTGIENGSYLVDIFLIGENGVCYHANDMSAEIFNCSPCFEPIETPCVFGWPVKASETGSGECTIDIATDKVYNSIIGHVGPGLCLPDSVIDIAITTCGNATLYTSPVIPSHWSEFNITIDGMPVADMPVTGITIPCGANIKIDVSISGCDAFEFNCSSVVGCSAELCDGSQTCNASRFLFTNFKMKYQPVQVLEDLKLVFCDGLPTIDYGDAVVIVEDNIPNMPYYITASGDSIPTCKKYVKEALEVNWGITGPYVTLDDYSNYMNEQLKMVPSCEDAFFSISKNADEEVVVTLSYDECSGCPVKYAQYDELGFGFKPGVCDSLKCLSQGYSGFVKSACGTCY